MTSSTHYPCSQSRIAKVRVQHQGDCDSEERVHFAEFFSGTGIVTSVPSDAPDDYAALRDLQKKEVKMLH